MLLGHIIIWASLVDFVVSALSKASAVFTLSLLLILVVSFVCSPINFQVAAVDRVPGVKVGDWVKYGNFLALWDSGNPGLNPSANILDANNTLWVTNSVRNVSGNSVTFDIESRYENGSVVSRVEEVDVATGVGSGNFSFVSAGLKADQSIYTSANLTSGRINSTNLRSFGGLYRETNLLNITAVSLELEVSSAYWTEYFWDRVTGVLVRQFYSLAYVDENGYLTLMSVEYEMIDNNMWFGVSDTVDPVAVAGADMVVEVGANVTFDGGGSRDNVGITDFLWDFGDGSSGKGLQVFHVFGQAGVYNVTLAVEDPAGHRVSDVLVVTVEQVPGGFSLWWLLPIGLVVLLLVLVSFWFFLRSRARKRPRTRMHR